MSQFTLPDLVKICPFPWTTSPHYEKAGAESAAWIDSFNVFHDRKRAYFIQSNTELLVSHVYSYAAYDEFRTCCDFVNLLFVVDEISDEQDAKGARETGDTFLRAMNGDLCGGPLLSHITGQFRDRLMAKEGKHWKQRFITRCGNYISAVTREADLRSNGKVLDVGAYISLRRENSAVQLCFGLFEYVHGIDLPNEVFEDPVFMRLYWAGIDLVSLSNDLYSYNMEQSKGLAGNNILTVLINDKKMTLQQAVDHVGDWFKSLLDQFIADKAKLRSFGSATDEEVGKYIFSMENWIIGNLIWSFETQRYFGREHLDIKRTLVVNVWGPEIDE